MARLKPTKVTRVKRDYAPFREALRKLLIERDLTQSKAADMLGMDARTFNHVIAGPTHPDLLLLRDIAEKFNVNLNYLFGLSECASPTPSIFVPDKYTEVGVYDHNEGAVQAEFHETKNTQNHIVLYKDFAKYINVDWISRVVDTECDALIGVNVFAWWEKTEFKKKGIYAIQSSGRNYYRWLDRKLGSEKFLVAKDVLMKDVEELSQEEFIVEGKLIRLSADF